MLAKRKSRTCTTPHRHASAGALATAEAMGRVLSLGDVIMPDSPAQAVRCVRTHHPEELDEVHQPGRVHQLLEVLPGVRHLAPAADTPGSHHPHQHEGRSRASPACPLAHSPGVEGGDDVEQRVHREAAHEVQDKPAVQVVPGAVTEDNGSDGAPAHTTPTRLRGTAERLGRTGWPTVAPAQRP